MALPFTFYDLGRSGTPSKIKECDWWFLAKRGLIISQIKLYKIFHIDDLWLNMNQNKCDVKLFIYAKTSLTKYAMNII